MLMHIRKAAIDDLDSILSIYRSAQDYMIASGNPDQWGYFYPAEELILEDVKNEKSLLICEDDEPHGVFALFEGSEPTYQYIENGEWLNDSPYVTLHRIASDGKVRGIFDCAIEYCKGISENIRIDTHKNNIIMQKKIEKQGFVKCGTIYVADGSPRIAYQWSNDSNR